MVQPSRDRAARPPLTGERDAPFTINTNTGDGWTLDGYGAVFNRETVINSSEGRFREKIAPGSMRKSFGEKTPRLQYDHGKHPLIGSFPIGTVERVAEEVDPVLAPEGGAHVIARMIPHIFFEPIRDAIAAGAINGMSFRFEVLRELWHRHDGEQITDARTLEDALRCAWRDDIPDHELPIRTLKELRVPELGPVAWPAYQDTSVSVRSAVIDLGALPHDSEQRKLFAKAMFNMAAQENTDAPRDTAESAVVEHPSVPDAPRDAAPEAVVEHPSNPTPRGSRAIDLVLRNQRDTLISMKGVRYERPTRGAARAARRTNPHTPAVGKTARRNPHQDGGTRRSRRSDS